MPNNNIYNVNWGKLATWLIPHVLRKPQYLAAVKAFVTPINDLHTRFLTFRTNTLYQLGINGQVCYMEKALNDKYDFDQRRITITDGVAYNAIPLFTDDENKPVTLFTDAGLIAPLVLYTDGETALFTTDFVVNVPASLNINTAELTAVVNSIKLLSKTFSINLI